MNIIDRPELAGLTTLRLGGRAIAAIRLDSLDDCEKLPEALRLTGGSAHVLGGGSNLLVHDGDLPITVIRPLMGSRNAEGRPAEPEILGTEEGPDGRYALLRVGAGMRMPFLLSWTVKRGLAGFEGLVSATELPEVDADGMSPVAESGEDLLRNVMSDITEIRKIAGIEPSRLILYTTSSWKRDVMSYALEMMADGKLTVPDLTKRCMSQDHIKRNGKAASELAKKVAVEFGRSTIEAKRVIVDLDENAMFSAAAAFLTEETGIPVEVYSADAEGLYDPQNKARQAAPGRPAIYLE